MSKSDKPLSHDLQTVKKKLGLTLITFEDAHINLEPFIRVHPFETVNFLTETIVCLTETVKFLTEAIKMLTETVKHLTEIVRKLTETVKILTETVKKHYRNGQHFD